MTHDEEQRSLYSFPNIINSTKLWRSREGNKLSGNQELPAFYGTRKFIAVCTKTHHLSQTCDTLIQATSCHFISFRSLPTLSSHLQLLLTGVISVIYHPTYLSLIGVSAKLPETKSSMAGCKVRTVLTVLCIMYGAHHRYMQCCVQNR